MFCRLIDWLVDTVGKSGARLREIGVLPGGGCEGRDTGGLICVAVACCMLIGCMLVDMPGGSC